MFSGKNKMRSLCMVILFSVVTSLSLNGGKNEFESKTVGELLPILIHKRDSDDEDSSTLSNILHWFSSQDRDEIQDATSEPMISFNPVEEQKRPVHSQEADLIAVHSFKDTMHVFFPELLSYVGDDDHATRRFAHDQVHLETEMYQLGIEFARLTNSGNLFRSLIARPFHIVRSLFSLLRYRNALHSRFAEDFSVIFGNPTEKARYDFEKYGLRLVNFEISLFGLFQADTGIDETTNEFPIRVEAAISRFEGLLKEFQEFSPDLGALYSIYVTENDRIKSMLRGLNHTIRRGSTSTNFNEPTSTSQASDITKNQSSNKTNNSEAEPEMDAFEIEFKSIKSTLAQCYQNGKVDAVKYKVVKTSLERLQTYLQQPSLPKKARLRLSEFLAEISPQMNRLVRLVSEGQGSTSGKTAPKFGEQNVNLSCQSLMNEIKKTEAYVNNLAIKHLKKKKVNSEAERHLAISEIDAQKSRLKAVQTAIEFAECITVAELTNLLQKWEIVEDKIAKLSKNLRSGESQTVSEAPKTYFERPFSPPPSAPELETFDSTENSMVEPFDLQLQEFEIGLQEFSKPTNRNMNDLQAELKFQKSQFQRFLLDSGTDKVQRTEERKFRVSNLKRQFQLLEGVFFKPF